MDWIAFKDQLPDIGRLILYGNHRCVEFCRFSEDHEKAIKRKLAYKDVTHWSYVDLPPFVNSTPTSAEGFSSSLA